MYVHHPDDVLNSLCFRKALQKRIFTRFKKKNVRRAVAFSSMCYYEWHVVEIIRKVRKNAYVIKSYARCTAGLSTFVFKILVILLSPFEECKHILKALNARNFYLICKHAQKFETNYYSRKFGVQGIV